VIPPPAVRRGRPLALGRPARPRTRWRPRRKGLRAGRGQPPRWPEPCVVTAYAGSRRRRHHGGPAVEECGIGGRNRRTGSIHRRRRYRRGAPSDTAGKW